MSTGKATNPRPPEAARSVQSEVAGAAPEPRKPTVTENVIVTVKILAGFGALGAALWGIDQLTAR